MDPSSEMAVSPASTEVRKAPARHRIHALDTLRAAAILWVVLCHLTGEGFIPQISSPAALSFLKAGVAGVDLFFVLSGYLIASIVLTELVGTGTLDVRRFWYRRWMRTLPAYYVTLAFIALSGFFWKARLPWAPGWSYLVFLQTTLVEYNQMRFGWSWSLCVEELFYLCLPLFVLAVVCKGGSKPKAGLLIISAIALLTSILSRAWLNAGHGPGDHIAGYGVPYCRLDGLAVGIVVATLEPMRNALRSNFVGALGLALLGVFVWSSHPYWFDTQRYLPLSIIFGLILYASVSNSFWRNLELPGIATIAAYSYAIYLLHGITLNAIGHFTLGRGWAVKFLIFLVFTVASALTMRLAVELPFLRLRDRRRSTIAAEVTN